MNIRFPKPLVPGDIIAITAPSSGVSPALHPRLDLAIGTLRKRGYRVIEGECLRGQIKNSSATSKQRAAELMMFLTDSNIAAVMPPWGGELAIELIDLLDFDALSSVPPKWFSGFSDLSTLQLPLAIRSGWATLHGPNLMQLAAAELDCTTSAIWSVLTLQQGQGFEQRSSASYERVGASLINSPAAGLTPSESTLWKRLDGSGERLTIHGRLIGGCIDSISRLAGTAYGDVPAFTQSMRDEGTVLYLENAELNPCELARALWGLRLNGWFNGMAGILFGRSAAPHPEFPGDLTYADALHSVLGDSDCPVLLDLDIGHLPPQLSLVNGAMAEVIFERGAGSIVQHMRSSPSFQPTATAAAELRR